VAIGDVMKETAQQYIKRIRGYVEGKKSMDVLSATPRQIAGLFPCFCIE
jgi:hypothetical protein